MFLGHHAVAFAGKKAAPQVRLGTLIFAAQFLDLLWPVLIITGVEHVRINTNAVPFLRLDLYDYPVSHSLITSFFWSVLVGGVYYVIKRNRRNAFIVSCLVFSHWLLDFFSHIPDLPLIPGWNYFVGLGLWNSTIATIVVEAVLFFIGVFYYFKSTKSKNRLGIFLPWTLIIFLSISYISSILSPPPPDSGPVGWIALLQWLFVPWGYWIDRHRESRSTT